MKVTKFGPTLIAMSLMTSSLAALGQQLSGQGYEGQMRDAWLVGKVEMAFTLNEHLNPFRINTDADAGVVTLSGTVGSDVDRDLAEEIATGIEGVLTVNNDLEVGSNGPTHGESQVNSGRDFRMRVSDATMTAVVKSKLIANRNIEALDIDVDTEGNVVTLSGRVDTEQQKELAGEITMNASDVREVRNLLIVDQS